MTIVAEGVETAEQADAMRRLGVDVIQGYFFSKPLDAGAISGHSAVSGLDFDGRCLKFETFFG